MNAHQEQLASAWKHYRGHWVESYRLSHLASPKSELGAFILRLHKSFILAQSEENEDYKKVREYLKIAIASGLVKEKKC